MQDVICGIYKITNLVNSKVYIGKSVDIYKRWSVHRSLLDCDKHYNGHLQHAWNKYGADNFIFEILCTASIDQLDNLEKEYIQHYNSTSAQYGYNKTNGGDGSIPTEETRQKMSMAHIGLLGTPESKRKQSLKLSGVNNPMYGRRGELSPTFGRTKSPEEIQKLKDVWTEERKEVYRNRVFGENNPMYGRTGGENPWSRKVQCINTGYVFDSLKEAAEWCGLSGHSTITEVCRGRQKSAGKHPDTKERLHWKYVD